MDLLETDIRLMRLLDHALALACHVAQDVTTRHFVILLSVGSSVLHADIVAAQSWLREYAYCGRYTRRCFHHGKHVCRLFEEVASQCALITLTSI
jgi:hypothetical protein